MRPGTRKDSQTAGRAAAVSRIAMRLAPAFRTCGRHLGSRPDSAMPPPAAAVPRAQAQERGLRYWSASVSSPPAEPAPALARGLQPVSWRALAPGLQQLALISRSPPLACLGPPPEHAPSTRRRVSGMVRLRLARRKKACRATTSSTRHAPRPGPAGPSRSNRSSVEKGPSRSG